MQRVAWVSDIHLDHLTENSYLEYKEYLRQLNPDCLIISGDIAEGDVVYKSLKDFNDSFDFPIYFVLGNHDFYFDSFSSVKNKIRKLVRKCKNLHWLTENKIIRLDDSTALIGIEGWGDGRNGRFDLGQVISRDIIRIKDFAKMSGEDIGSLLNSLGNSYAQSLSDVLVDAVSNYKKVYFVTHVPPFIETSLDRDLEVSSIFKLPFYTCKAIGDLLLDVMSQNTDCHMTVLCGHTHVKCDVQILENLVVRVKEAHYGRWFDATIIDL